MKIQHSFKAIGIIIFLWLTTVNLSFSNTLFDDLSKNDLKNNILLAQENTNKEADSSPPPQQESQTQETADDEIVMKAWVPSGDIEKPLKEQKQAELDDEIFNQLITLDLKDADLQNVIRLIAAKSNLNIIMTEKDVKGSITLHLENVKLGIALDSILRANDLAYIKQEGGIVRIVPLKQVQPEAIEKRVVRISLNWVQANEIKKTLDIVFRDAKDLGSISADEASNSLILRATPIFIEELQNLISQIDVPEKQVMLEARMVDLTETARRDLGLSWNLYRQDTSAASPSRTKETSDSSGAINTQGQNEYALDDLAMATTHNPAAALNWSYGDNITIFGKDFNLSSLLSALESRGLASTLHNPTVITLNNVEANIELVTQNPYVEAVQGPAGQFVSNQVKFKDSGVKLKVLPNITNNGYIRMQIAPTQDILADVAYGIPVINTRQATTNVIVKDEDTVAVGGMRQLVSTNNLNGVPWFHRIPLFGWLFKGTQDRQEKVENLLFVTPHIVKDPALNTEQQLKYDKIDYNWDLPDYFFDETKLRDKPKDLTKK